MCFNPHLTIIKAPPCLTRFFIYYPATYVFGAKYLLAKVCAAGFWGHNVKLYFPAKSIDQKYLLAFLVFPNPFFEPLLFKNPFPSPFSEPFLSRTSFLSMSSSERVFESLSFTRNENKVASFPSDSRGS